MESLICNNCKLKYNLNNRKPVMLMCGDTICQQCFYESRMPQDNSQFKCPFDDEVFDVPQNLIFNKTILRSVQSQMEQARYVVMCSTHQNRECDYICDQKEHFGQMLCGECMLEHTQHADKLKKIDWDSIVKQCESLLTQLNDSTTNIVKIVSWLQSFKNKDKICDFKEFQDNIQLAESFIRLLNRDEQSVGRQQDPQEEEEKMSDISNNQIKQKGNPLNKQDFFDNSSILQTKEDYQFLEQVFKNVKKAKLLYRGTRDGFDPKVFHRLCDNLGQTVTLARSHANKIFGGYSSISWQSIANQNQRQVLDKNAFIFSISHRSVHKIAQQIGYSVTHDPEYLPVFCGGFGISMCCRYSGRCNIGISNLGAVFACPPGMKYPDIQTLSYLAGAYEFVVDEIEVYQVQ